MRAEFVTSVAFQAADGFILRELSMAYGYSVGSLDWSGGVQSSAETVNWYLRLSVSDGVLRTSPRSFSSVEHKWSHWSTLLHVVTLVYAFACGHTGRRFCTHSPHLGTGLFGYTFARRKTETTFVWARWTASRIGRCPLRLNARLRQRPPGSKVPTLAKL